VTPAGQNSGNATETQAKHPFIGSKIFHMHLMNHLIPLNHCFYYTNASLKISKNDFKTITNKPLGIKQIP